MLRLTPVLQPPRPESTVILRMQSVNLNEWNRTAKCFLLYVFRRQMFRLPGLLSNWTTFLHLSTASASVFVVSLHSNNWLPLSRRFLDISCHALYSWDNDYWEKNTRDTGCTNTKNLFNGSEKNINEFVVCVWRYMLFKCQIEAATMTIQQPVSSKHHARTLRYCFYILESDSHCYTIQVLRE